MVRLLGETVALKGDHAAKKGFLLNGLGEWVGADGWAWTLSRPQESGGGQTCVASMCGGLEATADLDLPGMLGLPDQECASGKFGIVTADGRRGPIHLAVDGQTPPDRPEGAAIHGEIRKRPGLLSLFPLKGYRFSSTAIFRSPGAPPFSAREQQLVRLILEEVPWLHLPSGPDKPGRAIPKLSPRQRTVLKLLLEGLGRKQIAAHLDISPNTVAGYCKEIYRHFGVNSQTELTLKVLKVRP